LKDLYKRTLTGAILVILLYTALFSGPVTFFIFFSLLNLIGLWEFYSMIKNPVCIPQKWAGMVAGVLSLSIFYLVTSGILQMEFFYLVVPIAFVLLLIELYRKTDQPVVNVGLSLFALLYITVPVGVLGFMAYTPSEAGGVAYSPWIISAYFLLIMINDSAGYLVGVPFGKNRLFERISPKKSWEGAIGGLVFTLLAAWLVSIHLTVLSMFSWLVVGLLVVVFGTFGDLVESMFKRSMNLKDSGSIFPGHGGILDRYDAIFISAPFVVAFLKLFIWNS
jgi:phosphatidate cytidylyltransferase